MSVPREAIGLKSLEDALWVVWDRHGMAVAALSFAQDDEFKVRWMFDLYGAPGHALAGLQLVKAFERFCDDTGYEMRGDTDPENTHYLQLVLARGYELTSISFRRRPQKRTSEIHIEEALHG